MYTYTYYNGTWTIIITFPRYSEQNMHFQAFSYLFRNHSASRNTDSLSIQYLSTDAEMADRGRVRTPSYAK